VNVTLTLLVTLYLVAGANTNLIVSDIYKRVDSGFVLDEQIRHSYRVMQTCYLIVYHVLIEQSGVFHFVAFTVAV
jgi:hypothetical protein